MAQTLDASLVGLIFRELDSLKDIAEASRVCRAWCWQLWRDEAQFVFWRPRILKALQEDKDRRVLHIVSALSKLSIERKLGFRDQSEVLATLQLVKEITATLNQKTAKAMWLLEGLWKKAITSLPLNGTYPSGIDVGGTYWSVGEDGQKACYQARQRGFGSQNQNPVVQCLRGEFDGNANIKDGEMYLNSRLVYRGEWLMGVPHGRGSMFDAFGLGYQGEWRDGKSHGAGVAYFDDGINKHFDGQFEDGEKVIGTWYDMSGLVVHQGSAEDFVNRVRECQEQHRCTYSVTRHCFVKQEWAHCRTCFGQEKMVGICLVCARRDHKGHDVVLHEESDFFCDCGAGDAPEPCGAMIACDEGCECSTEPIPQELPEGGEGAGSGDEDDSDDDDGDGDGEGGGPPPLEVIAMQLQAQIAMALGRDVEVVIRDRVVNEEEEGNQDENLEDENNEDE